ncbi:hypothetical protein ACIP6V_23750 [Streptomyces sp. NPDC088770]|uniref:hypothetical protein n=1 Tax=unclassified Streptomyces TaxID=2593676 RepID=UPI002DDA7039|nr:hypothetical protein [Streptomyces sp. NBC_01788]WSB29691.1 hypothetical protein OIE49_29505 [Streptomyces sp. NBC_01788]
MDALFNSLNLIGPGDLVLYHGTLTDAHGLWLAMPCPCNICHAMDALGLPDVRFALIDPWDEQPGPFHARRASITRSAACG